MRFPWAGFLWLAQTESLQPESFFRRHYAGAQGTVWVRLGTRSRRGAVCDLDNFVRGALSAIRGRFALITTDGDASVSSDLAEDTVERLLDCPQLVSWHTQNCTLRGHPKLVPMPVGLDLHTVRAWRSGYRLLALLSALRDGRRAPQDLPLEIFCDLAVKPNSEARRQAIAVLRNCAHADLLSSRISQPAVWQRYIQYPFVVSAPGNGLDCHRTWELLYLGAIVITKTSPLDPLYEGLPVAIVEDWDEMRDPANLEKWLRLYGPLTARDHVWTRLHPNTLMASVRAALAAGEGALTRPRS